MKNKITKNRILISVLCVSFLISVFSVAGIAFAVPAHWFGSTELPDSSAAVKSWIKTAVTSKDGFDADEALTVKFAVTQWAESGNYKLVLSGINFYSESRAEILSADQMWEYYAAADTWLPVSQALNLKLIPKVTVQDHTAYLKIRLKPGFFILLDWADYLDYSLELFAELISL
ncbi:MAG: hypothetical protein FWE62_00825 [Firmicutes bacterium]|nr:hypothetical protein [Bacillota bacterium]